MKFIQCRNRGEYGSAGHDDEVSDVERQLRERFNTAEKQQAAAVDRYTLLLADRDTTLSQIKDQLTNIEQHLTEETDKNAHLVDQLNVCRTEKVNLAKDLELEKAATTELRADVAHLRADLADVTELRGLETTNRLLREDLDRVELRLKQIQLDNSRLDETRSVSEVMFESLKLELESTTSELRQKDSHIKNLEETNKTLRSEIGDLKNSATHTENLATRTQTELAAVSSELQQELTNAKRQQRQLDDETAKSQRLEKPVVDLYAELESRDLKEETEAKKSRVLQQEIETKLSLSQEENTKLKDLMRVAKEEAKDLEEQFKTGDKRLVGLSSDDNIGRRVLEVSLSAKASGGPAAEPASGRDKLGERHAVAVRRMKTLELELHNAEARRVVLEDENALLRQQLTDNEFSAEQLIGKVEQLTTQLDSTERTLQQLKVSTEQRISLT